MCRQGVKDLLTSLQDHRFSIQHVFHCYSHVLDHRSFDITYISDLFKKTSICSNKYSDKITNVSLLVKFDVGYYKIRKIYLLRFKLELMLYLLVIIIVFMQVFSNNAMC